MTVIAVIKQKEKNMKIFLTIAQTWFAIIVITAMAFTACTKKSETQSKSPMEGDINMVQIQTPLTDFEIDGTTLVKYIGNETSVVIPDSIIHIEESAFYQKYLTSVIIPDSVTSIGDGAFFDNQLTGVIIPKNVTSIGQTVFCKNQLSSVTIPNSVTYIGKSAFSNNKLTGVTIPDSVTSIDSFAFAYNQLTSVTIPNSVTLIGDEAFSNNQLTGAVIPDSVTSIGDRIFNRNPFTESSSVYYVKFNNKTIPITVFYSSKNDYGSNLDKVVFNYDDVTHTINLNGMEFDNEMYNGSIKAVDNNSDGFMDISINDYISIYNPQTKNYNQQHITTIVSAAQVINSSGEIEYIRTTRTLQDDGKWVEHKEKIEDYEYYKYYGN